MTQMSSVVVVRDLPPTVKVVDIEQQVRKLDEYATVEIQEKGNGLSRALVGYITFRNNKIAERAVRQLNNADIHRHFVHAELLKVPKDEEGRMDDIWTVQGRGRYEARQTYEDYEEEDATRMYRHVKKRVRRDRGRYNAKQTESRGDEEEKWMENIDSMRLESGYGRHERPKDSKTDRYEGAEKKDVRNRYNARVWGRRKKENDEDYDNEDDYYVTTGKITTGPMISIMDSEQAEYPLDGRKWGYGISREVGVLNGKTVQITFIDIESPILPTLLNEIGRESLLTLDVEWFYRKSPHIDVFEFGYSKGALVVHSPEGMDQTFVEKFLRESSHRKFVANDCVCQRKMLSLCFRDIVVNMDDIGNSDSVLTVKETVKLMIGETFRWVRDEMVARSRWDRQLSELQVMYAAFGVVGLYHYTYSISTRNTRRVEICKETKMISKPKMVRGVLIERPKFGYANDWNSLGIVDGDPIIFSGTGINAYPLSGGKSWGYNIRRKVSFFHDREGMDVTLVHIDSPILERLLEDIGHEVELSLDMESYIRNKIENAIFVFQIGYSEGALVIHSPAGGGRSCGGDLLKSFFRESSGRSFIAKSCTRSIGLLRQMLSPLRIELEDVTRKRLFGMGLKFPAMVELYGGDPAVTFDTAKAERSEWRQELCEHQVMYAAFDAIGLYVCIPNLPPKTQKRK